MIYDHDVKINGKWYVAGTEVPATNTTIKAESKAIESDEIKVEADTKPAVDTKRSSKKK